MDSNTIPPEFNRMIKSATDWRQIVAWVSDLAPLPQVASKAITLIENPDTSSNELSCLLERDTALAARVLKIANSAMFARQREITTLNQAVMMIGYKTLKGVIVAATLQRFAKRGNETERMVWENSTGTAVVAHKLAMQINKEYADECFLLGLLHDMGKLVLLREIPLDYKKIVECTRGGASYFEAEQEILGFSHPLIGALVAKKWNFSDDICQAILHHHDDLCQLAHTPLNAKTAIIQTADLMTHYLGKGHLPGYQCNENKMHETLAFIGISDAGKIEATITACKEAIEKHCSILE